MKKLITAIFLILLITAKAVQYELTWDPYPPANTNTVLYTVYEKTNILAVSNYFLTAITNTQGTNGNITNKLTLPNTVPRVHQYVVSAKYLGVESDYSAITSTPQLKPCKLFISKDAFTNKVVMFDVSGGYTHVLQASYNLSNWFSLMDYQWKTNDPPLSTTNRETVVYTDLALVYTPVKFYRVVVN